MIIKPASDKTFLFTWWTIAVAMAALISVTMTDSLAQTIILRNWGGVRITQEINGIRIVITTENQTRIARIAMNDPDPQVRIAAVRKLTDQHALAQVARQDSEFKVRMAALERG